MTIENDLPDWTAPVFETIASTISLKSIGSLIGWYKAPDENMWGVHLVQIEPGLIEISGGPHDGEQGFNPVYGFDLLAAQQAFDEVESLSFGIERDGRPCITIIGKVGQRSVVVLIYAEPGEDAEVSEIIEDEPDNNREVTTTDA